MEYWAGDRVRSAGLLRTGAVLLLSLLSLCLLGAGQARAADGHKPKEDVGTLTIDVSWDRSRQEVLVSETCTYTLAAHSRALAEARKTTPQSCGGYTVRRYGTKVGTGWRTPHTEMTQASPDDPARVKSSSRVHLGRWSSSQDVTIVLDVEELARDKSTDFPTAWIVKVSARKWSFGYVTGPVESQSPSTVGWRVETAPTSLEETVAVTRSVTLSRYEKTTKPPSARHQTREEMLTALALAVCGIGVVAAPLVARLAGPAVPRRWAAATMAFVVAVCLSAPVGVLEGYSLFSFASEPPPDMVWLPAPVLGLWLWYVLPVAGWWFSRRVVTGRPPSLWVLLAGCAPLLLAFSLMRTDVTVSYSRDWFLVVPVAGCAWALIVPLRRRWAATAVALLWIVLVTYWLGQSLSVVYGGPRVSNWRVAALLVCTWPAAAWITSLLGPVLRRAPGPTTRTACFVLLWGTMMSPFLVAGAAKPRQNEVGYWHYSEYYRNSLFTGYAAFPFFVVAVCGVALQIAYLLRRGGLGDGGRAVEPVGRVLLVCAVLLALGSPSLRTLSMWGDALAVLWVALAAFLVLIPLGSSVTAARFRRVSRQAHARFMDRWVTTQLVWDTRADFQRAARSALAEGMTVSDFSDRWHELDVPGRYGDPAKRLARAKRFALGSSAGVAPRTAGLAGAALGQLLALPWAAYKLWTSGPVGADLFMPFHLDELSMALRFGHWALYGFVFGYFYALLRGHTPIGKAAFLTAVILPAEVLPMITLTIDPQYTQDPSWTDMWAACGGVAGQSVVVCMGLGLGWEWWLARAAGMKWSQVRNFRRLSSITVPAGTVLVAGATAFATAVAGSWAQPAQQRSPEPPPGVTAPASAPGAP
ncbi:hypothetical protein [Streptomyces sp. NPDC001275]